MKSKPGVGDILHLKHPSGSSATISRLGVTVLSLQTPRTGEILWLDPDWPQYTSGGNNRHGGIPVMFPTFGNVGDTRIVGKGDQQDMLRYMQSGPHHGFAKDCVWDVVTNHDNDNHYDWPTIESDDNVCQLLLRLCPDHVPADLGGSWLRESGDWEIFYRISLQRERLILDLRVKNNNTGEDVQGDLRAKLLFHNYFRAPSPSTVRLYGLKNNFDDPIESDAASHAGSDVVLSFRVPGGVDRVSTLKNDSTVNVTIGDDKDKVKAHFDITASNLPDLVVWAPKVKAEMDHSTLEQDTRFVCIERGMVVQPFAVPTGSCMFFRQVLST